MKLLLPLFFLGTFLSMAQPKNCEYEVNEKTDSTSFKMLPHKLMSEKIFGNTTEFLFFSLLNDCLLYTSPSPRDRQKSRMPSSA